ncbi:hypothetical protein BaOVIS_020990 [Babesia ovis]|uniref:RNA-editing substrate-binding complex 6 protein domain-containing protein n=1 Tax=Babesia ovis TaxID=5869 RepID=A0A9W5TC00_BABOV|nr:hypothetical protein BaOVIS_020990 [Babesia ovis]
MATKRSVAALLLQRRCMGYIMRYGSAGDGKSIGKPSDVSRYIEKVAKESSHEERNQQRQRCAELVELMCSNINQYTAMEVRAVAHGMAIIFGNDVKSKWLQSIANFSLRGANVMPVYLLYPLVNSLGKMAKPENGLPFDKLLQVCIKRISEANSIDLATMAQTAVLLKKKLGIREVMDQVANAAIEQPILCEISATNAVLILYAFAQTGIKHGQLCQELTKVMTAMRPDDFQIHLIPLALYALARLGIKDRQVMETMTTYALKVTDQMGPENVSGTVCALARLKFNHPRLLTEMATRTKQLMPSIGVREMSNILWGFAKLRYDDTAFVDDMIDRCVQYSDIDNMSFAQMFEAIRCYHAVHKIEVIRQLLQRYIAVMQQCSTQIVTQVAWCFTSLGCNDHGIISKSLEELKLRNRNKVEQRFVEMLLESLKSKELLSEETLRHYIAELTAW